MLAVSSAAGLVGVGAREGISSTAEGAVLTMSSAAGVDSAGYVVSGTVVDDEHAKHTRHMSNKLPNAFT